MNGFDSADIVGKRFGRLIVEKEAEPRWVGKNKSKHYFYKCKCDCGKILIALRDSLLSGGKRSCGCLLKENASRIHIIDLSGKRFGRLRVISEIPEKRGDGGRVIWHCICDCGKEKDIPSGRLRSGNVKSCSCGQVENLKHLALLTAKRIGNKHPRWNPKLTNEERINERHIFEWNKIRKNVIVRDNFICVICGDGEGGNLNAHHLASWKDFPEKRLDMDNLITVCEDCHKDIHAIKRMINAA
ncbi:MAG: HNH endonuclease signature motif containing protein [Patescibacteria group bacterium]